MTRLLWAALFLLLLPLVSEAQVLCTPLGDTTYCAGYDSQMNDRALTITPLGGGMSIITESRPLMKARPEDPGLLVPLALATRRINPMIESPSMESPSRARLESLLEDRPRMHDDLLPPLPFPE